MGNQGIPPAAPAAPPAAAPPVPTPQPPAQDLTGASDAARDRLATAFPDQPVVEGAPPADAAGGAAPTEDAPIDIFADGALEGLDFSGMQYRDGKKLENEIRSARERFRPFNDAFGQMSDEARQALLQAAPTLGDDLATLGAAAGVLHPDDRAYFAEAMRLMQTDPQAAAEMLSHGAEVLRSAYQQPGAVPPAPPAPGTSPMPEWAQPPAGEGEPVADPLDAPMTMRQYQEAQERDAYARDVRQQEQAIIDEAKSLGYDPDSTDPIAAARLSTLVSLAGRPEIGGDLSKAHELMEQARQADIDAFVKGKTADAADPTAPNLGAPPAERRVLETSEDGLAAMTNRLDATLGPDPRRRAADD